MRIALAPPPEADRYTAWGAEVAARRLIDNFRAYGSDIEFETLTTSVEAAEISGRATEQSIQVTARSAATGAAYSRWDILHDVLLRDPQRYGYVRTHSQTCFPIVVTHHALCHPMVLEHFFVPLLLARSQPYDAVVCTSRAARQAFMNLLEICAEGVAPLCGGRPPNFEGQLPVISLGVDTDLFRPRAKDDLRHQVRLPGEACVMLWV